ncbi:hypothetical protein F4779DRAFT_617072 [Xylariaceae sp. FL0662B]|nr:hypothetical protein F4779DRAFT_617072 [Xylariaceae sp. FL0662B]
MVSNKDRLYIALYARSGAPKMPGLEDTNSLSAKEKITLVGRPPRPQSIWQYEERTIHLQPTQMLLVRVVVGKVKDTRRLQSKLRQIPVRPEIPDWNCVSWVKEALQVVISDKKAMSTVVPSWDSARDPAMWYVESKKASHRFDGQAPAGQYDSDKAATWDMLEGKELIA